MDATHHKPTFDPELGDMLRVKEDCPKCHSAAVTVTLPLRLDCRDCGHQWVSSR